MQRLTPDDTVIVSGTAKGADTLAEHWAWQHRFMVIGRVAASAFTGQDGSPRASLEVTADSVRFLGCGRGDGAALGAPGGNGASAHIDSTEEEDIPF